MMPSQGDILCVPFTDPQLHLEQSAKAQFWTQEAFYGIDLSALAKEAEEEYMGQAVVGYFTRDCLISNDTAVHKVNAVAQAHVCVAVHRVPREPHLRVCTHHHTTTPHPILTHRSTSTR